MMVELDSNSCPSSGIDESQEEISRLSSGHQKQPVASVLLDLEPSRYPESTSRSRRGRDGGEETAETSNDAEDSDGSFSSFFSEYSREEENDCSDESASEDLKLLEREFRERDASLEHLVKGIDPTYARLMRENEQAVRKLKLRRLQLKHCRSLNGEQLERISMPNIDTHGQTVNDDRKWGLLERARRAIAFDLQNTLQGGFIVVLNCIAYRSCSETVDSLIFLLTGTYPNQDLVAVVNIVLAVVLLRFTGGLWEWLSPKAYQRTKYDINNKMRLGKTDARIMRWFRKRRFIYTFANVFAFYMCYEATAWLQERSLVPFDKHAIIYANLPSVKQGTLSDISERVLHGFQPEKVQRGLGYEYSGTCVADNVCDVDEVHANLSHEDLAYLDSTLSLHSYEEFIGQDDAVFVSEWTFFCYNLASVCLSIFMLQKLGHSFWSH